MHPLFPVHSLCLPNWFFCLFLLLTGFRQPAGWRLTSSGQTTHTGLDKWLVRTAVWCNSPPSPERPWLLFATCAWELLFLLSSLIILNGTLEKEMFIKMSSEKHWERRWKEQYTSLSTHVQLRIPFIMGTSQSLIDEIMAESVISKHTEWIPSCPNLMEL